MVLSSDSENDSDILALIGASTALAISDIPFEGPIGAVRVGRIGGKLVINPTNSLITARNGARLQNVRAYAANSWIGLPTSQANWIALCLVVLFMGIAYGRRMIAEEAMLVDKFGEEYRQYKKNVPKPPPLRTGDYTPISYRIYTLQNTLSRD